MNLSIKYALLIALTFSLISCADKKEVKRAPATEAELGFIVSGPALEDVIAANVSYRVVNKKHKLFEVYEDKETISNAFPLALLEKNKFRQNIFKQSQHEIFLRDQKKLENFVKTCKKAKPLSLYIDSSANDTTKDKINYKMVVELGKSIDLKVLQLDGDVENTEFLWSLNIVGMAKYKEYVSEGKQITFKPDGLGLNVINVVAKDKNNNCGLSQIEFLVTSNTPYKDDSPVVKKSLSPSTLDHIVDANIPAQTDNFNKVKIAIIDTGVNYNHYELHDSISRNFGEVPGNMIDDDGNGFIDDYTGYDFYSGDPYPMDDSGHGTHIAGLIAGKSTGVTGNALIIPIKAGEAHGIDVASLTGAIYYAVDMGAQVINLSLGSYHRPRQIELDALKYTQENNVVVVTAAGNGDPNTGIGLSLNIKPMYPASLALSNKIVVAASSKGSKPLTIYSNYGSVVDIVAPGGDVQNPLYSAAIENNIGLNYRKMHGTSMAAPVVAGVVVEMLSRNPELSPQQVRKIIIESGDLDDDLKKYIRSQKHLNATIAYKMLDEFKAQ